MRGFLPLITILIISSFPLRAIALDCPGGQVEVVIDITADNYPNETSWDLRDADGNILAEGEAEGSSLCADTGQCLTFTIYDSYGDGICCGYGNGSYEVYYGGQLVASGGNFNYIDATSFNCPPGYSCQGPIVIGPGEYTAPANNYWYEFTPDTTGIYTITTCDLNDCDTKLWIYDECDGTSVTEDNTGTLYYDDNEGCDGGQAQITAYLENTVTYLIRIGSAGGDCTSPIDWQLIFGGEIYGCMDPLACNYNPLATVDDGSCLEEDDPECGIGPDLWVLESVLRNSLQAGVINNNTDNCLISEGCVAGFGRREVVRFTTHIKNIGDTDYYIGHPSDQPDQFSFDNCHNHWHYEGYAEYRLLDADQNPLPVGFKNGFCVIDLECEDGGIPKYGCGNMGISAGCGDYYDAGLQCQWIDVTGLPAGTYTLIVTVNWDQSPDALGNHEARYDNNWAQVCFNLARLGQNLQVSVNPNCPEVVDCAGMPFGDAVEDCAGVCQGTNLYGDLNGDQAQTTADAETYIFDILNGGLEASPCFDLNDDGLISVFDAALVNSCYLYGMGHQHQGGVVHNHCVLPGGVENPTHHAKLTILNADLVNYTLDIGISNPNDHIMAFEFNMSGINMLSVTNLADAAEYPVTPRFSAADGKIIGISLVDSMISKTNGAYQPLCRIAFEPLNEGEICISEIVDIINEYNHKISASIEDGCLTVVNGVSDLASAMGMTVFPNPGHGRFTISYHAGFSRMYSLEVLDALGQVVLQRQHQTGFVHQPTVDLSTQPPGIYYVRMTSDLGTGTVPVMLLGRP